MFTNRLVSVCLVFALLLFNFPLSVFAGDVPVSDPSIRKTMGSEDGGAKPSAGASDDLSQSGSFAYTVPIDVPPGTHGLQPNIILSYNSSNGSGWCGMGWDLSFGVIQRSTKSGIPKYDSTDTFVFSSGGASQELVNIGGNEYRAKIDSAFIKFVFDPDSNDNKWIAYDKGGTKYIFGHGWGESAKVVKPTVTGTPQPNDVFSWSLSSIIDTNGNEIYFFYTHDQNQIYPSAIQYSHHLNEAPPMRSVVFELGDREDRLINCRAGFAVKTAKRLKTITTTVDNSTILIYTLDYTNSKTGKSLLASLTKTDSQGKYFPPYLFAYNDFLNSFGENQEWPSSGNTLDLRDIYTYQYYNKGYSYDPYSYENSYFHTEVDFLDINGDGLPDHVGKHRDNAYFSVRLNLGDHFGENQNWNTDYNFDDHNEGDLRYEYEELDNRNAEGEIIDTLEGERDTKVSFIDINGDGFPDQVGKSVVCLNKNGYFEKSSLWSSPYLSINRSYVKGGEKDYLHIRSDLADINSDGLLDQVSKTNSEDSFYVRLRLSNGQFDTGKYWPTPHWTGPGLDSLRYIFTGTEGENNAYSHMENDFIDINGDGLPDQVGKHRDENKFRVRLNLGDRFGDEQEWLIPAIGEMGDIRYTYTEIGGGDIRSHTEKDFVDINGDGLPDYVEKHRGEDIFYARLNLGDHFGEKQSWPVPHWNGAGWDDLRYVYTDKNDSYDDYTHITHTYLHSHTENDFVDINGDGLPDQVGKHRTENFFRVRLNQAQGADLLKEITTPQGGIITSTYETYIQKDQNLPFSVNVVKSISTNDSLGNVVTTSYTYSGGLYDRSQKEFLGFAQVTKTDAEGNYAITKFFQNETFDSPDIFPYKGRVKEELVYDKNNVLLVDTTYGYTCVHPQGKTNWFFPQLWQTRTTTNDGGVAKTTGNDFGYDDYGNITVKLDLGDTSIGNDDVINVISYYEDTANYIVGLPLVQEVRDFNSVTQAKTTFEYYSTGNLKKKSQWLNTGPTDPVVEMTYDDYGNVLTVKDAKGNTTITTYDEIYHTFPITVTNAKGHITSATYDPSTGNVLTETDANGQITAYTYDTFGRPLTVLSPIDNGGAPSVVYNYYDNEFPRKILTRTKQKGRATGDTAALNYIREYQFYDGLGRVAQTKSETVSNWGNWIISDCKTYSNRGLVERAYDVYFPTNTPPYTTFTYDALGRVTRQDNPDGSYTTSALTGWTETKTDGNSHSTDYHKDAFGRIITVTEHIAGQAHNTHYTYDTLGHLTKIVNAIGETTTITYDSLGRKTAMSDPKMGNWSYTYDANGNLISQTDGKGQTTTLEYDSLNRITKKTYPDSTTIVYEYDTETEPYAKGRLIKITDPSGSTKFTYDAIGRITTTQKDIIDGVEIKTYTTSSQYNASGQQTRLIYPNIAEARSSYDAGGNLFTVHDGLSIYTGVMQYNHHKQLLRIDYGNGLSTGYKYKHSTSRLEKLISGTTGAAPVPPPPDDEDPGTPPPPEDDPGQDPPPPDDGGGGYNPPTPGDPGGSEPPSDDPGGGDPGMGWPDPTFIFPNTKDFKAFDEFMEMLERGEVQYE